ncbi:unnamed protein product [Prunus brigantina]
MENGTYMPFSTQENSNMMTSWQDKISFTQLLHEQVHIDAFSQDQ